MSWLHDDMSVTCSACGEAFPTIETFKAHRRRWCVRENAHHVTTSSFLNDRAEGEADHEDRYRHRGADGAGGRMKKAIGFVLAGWPFMILLGTLLHEAYQDIGIGGIVIMLAGFFVAGCSVWVGMNLMFPMKGEG